MPFTVPYWSLSSVMKMQADPQSGTSRICLAWGSRASLSTVTHRLGLPVGQFTTRVQRIESESRPERCM